MVPNKRSLHQASGSGFQQGTFLATVLITDPRTAWNCLEPVSMSMKSYYDVTLRYSILRRGQLTFYIIAYNLRQVISPMAPNISHYVVFMSLWGMQNCGMNKKKTEANDVSNSERVTGKWPAFQAAEAKRCKSMAYFRINVVSKRYSTPKNTYTIWLKEIHIVGRYQFYEDQFRKRMKEYNVHPVFSFPNQPKRWKRCNSLWGIRLWD